MTTLKQLFSFSLTLTVLFMSLEGQDVEWTGYDLRMNGQSEFPRGLWGVMSTDRIPNPKANGVEWTYAPWNDLRQAPPQVKTGEPQSLIGIFDGEHPALQRISPRNWKKRLWDLIDRLPKSKTPFDFLVNPKGWEEGYGINGYGKFFDRHKAQPNRAVTLAGKEVDGLIWDEEKWVLLEFRGQLRMDWTSRMTLMGDRFTMDEWYEPKPLKTGSKVKINNRWAVLQKEWWAKDALPIPQRGVSWWSYNPKIWRSPQYVQNRKLFLELVKAWSEHPASGTRGHQVSFGWGAPWLGSTETQWQDIIKPMIEQGAGNLFHLSDVIHGESTDKVMAGYELAWNHSLNLRNRPLKFRTIGIEGVLHPTSPKGNFEEPPLKESEEYEIGSFLYHTKDLLSRMMLMPHKAKYRFLAKGEHGIGALAALNFLSDMKGQMVALNINDPMILAVASRRGKEHRICLMNDDHRSRNVTLGFSGHRFLDEKIKIIRPKLGGSFPNEEKEVTMTSLLNLKMKPREVLQLVFKTDKGPVGKREMEQFSMRGKPRRNISSHSLNFMSDLDGVEAGDRLILRLNTDRPVSGIELQGEDWGQKIHHLRQGLQDHPLTYKPKEGRWSFSLKSSSKQALFEGASLFLVSEKKY